MDRNPYEPPREETGPPEKPKRQWGPAEWVLALLPGYVVFMSIVGLIDGLILMPMGMPAATPK